MDWVRGGATQADWLDRFFGTKVDRSKIIELQAIVKEYDQRRLARGDWQASLGVNDGRPDSLAGPPRLRALAGPHLADPARKADFFLALFARPAARQPRVPREPS